jgi:uncharacterized protein (TIGR02569 family)
MTVPEEVRHAFGIIGPAEALGGGMAPAFRVGDVVVKPVEDAVEAGAIAELMAEVAVDEQLVRVARPVPTTDGTWVAHGWSAWWWEPGRVEQEACQPWAEALAAVRELSRGLAVFPPPASLGRRGHPWAQADRFAWGEADFELRHPDVERLVAAYLDAYRPVELEAQFIHGDTYANLLFEPGLAPAVIDFSPYWRPAGYGLARYVVDALWSTCEPALVRLVANEPAMDQLLYRSAVFRLVSNDRLSIERGYDIGQAVSRHWGIAKLLGVL